MKQENLVNGKKFATLRQLYNSQNREIQAKMRVTVLNCGFNEGSIYRIINSKKVDTDVMDALYFTYGIVRHPKEGYFFEPVVTENETFGLS